MFIPNNINTLSREELWELIFTQILSSNSVSKCMETALENLYVYHGLKDYWHLTSK